jgi:ornithine cyclodeaminase/alanine dehydrogenase-like protein (mu-crystallin family)
MGRVRVLSEADVRALVSVREAQTVIEEAFRDFSNGVSRMAARVTVPIPGIMGNIRILPAVKVLPHPRPMPPTRGYLGVKVYTGYVGPVFKDPTKDRFTLLLHDMNTGALLAIVAARYLGALRTGATAAVATRHMANPGARTLCVVGPGEQGETQATNLAALLAPERVLIVGRTRERSEALAVRLAADGIRAEATDDLEQAVRASDVICTATTSREPLLHRAWIRPGAHINAVGANLANRREIAPSLVKASRVVVEYRDQALQEAGDLLMAIDAGEITADAIHADLGEVVSGRAAGRTSPDEITLFKSIGVAIEDVAVAAFAYEKAARDSVGTLVTM